VEMFINPNSHIINQDHNLVKGWKQKRHAGWHGVSVRVHLALGMLSQIYKLRLDWVDNESCFRL